MSISQVHLRQSFLITFSILFLSIPKHILILNQLNQQSMSQAFESHGQQVTQSPKQLEGELAKRFQFVAALGEGTFGMVSSVYDRTKQTKFALKKIKLSRKTQGLPPSAIREVALLKSLNHPNIIKIEEVFYDCQIPSLSFTLELLPYNLHDLLKQKYQLSVARVKRFARQLLLALQFLHRRGIIHRDLKPQNVLISEDHVLKLCDFGQAKLTLFGEYNHTPDISTLWYRAPQILLGANEYDEGVDTWAAGCVIAEMALGKPLFRGNSELAMIHSIFQLLGTPKQAEYPEISNMQYYSPTFPKFESNAFSIQGLSKEGQDFIRKLLVVNPKNRLNVEDALRHEFVCGEE